MKIEQIYTGCLAQGAYYIESEGQVAIIDPLREVQPYINKAAQNNAKITYIFETHFHADFVSGHVELSKKTGAPIIYGPTANTSFESIIAADGQAFKLGNITIVVLHTPGHTMESTTYLLRDEKGKDHAIFSGDTLFLGDVGRPDLAQKNGDITQEQLASTLFDSLRTKIMPLADDVTVYPAHGAGSACGKNMMKETVDTLGNQKKMNYALRADMTREEFISEVTEGLVAPPAYFPLNVKMNKEGYKSMDEVMERGMRAYKPSDFEDITNEAGALVLDVRTQQEFAAAHVPRSIFIGLNGSFAPWVGELIRDVEQPIILVANADQIEEAITRLSRVGFDNVIGYLDGGITAWIAAGRDIDNVVTEDAATVLTAQANNLTIVDVRKPSEYDAEHIEGAINISLREVNEHFDKLPTDQPFYVHCLSGYRSVIAASILKSRGYHNFINVDGGIEATKHTEAKMTAFTCPTTIAESCNP